MKKQKINIALVCSAGGHFEQMINLSEFYEKFEHFWITNRNKQTISQLKNDRKQFIKSAHFKKPWTYLDQIPILLKVFLREKPTHILSTGSGRTAFIPFLLAKALRVRFLNIDTFSRVYGYSKFGTFLLRIGHSILSQWDDPQSKQNRKVIYIGPVFRRVENFSKNPNPDYVFVTLGTRPEQFARLIESVEDLVRKGTINEKVVVQAGNTKYSSDYLEIFDFCTPERINKLVKNAKFIITQESAGISTKCLRYKTKFIVMPRDYQYGELNTKSDMNEDLHFKLEEMGYTKVANNVRELEKTINELKLLKTDFKFDNKLAVTTLTRIMEEI